MAKILILVFSLLVTININADVYQHRDANGNLVFSDTPSPNSTQVQLPDNLSQVSLPAPASSAPSAASSDNATTAPVLAPTVNIINPTNNATWSQAQTLLNVTASVKNVDPKAGAKAMLLVNGAPFAGTPVPVSGNQQISFELRVDNDHNDIPIGQVSLQVQIIDSATPYNILATSDTVNFTNYQPGNRVNKSTTPTPSTVTPNVTPNPNTLTP